MNTTRPCSKRRIVDAPMIAITIAISVAITQSACGNGEFGLAQMGDDAPGAHVPEAVPETVGTLHALGPNAVRAGEPVTVRCLEQDDGAWRAPAAGVTLTVTPNVHVVQGDASGTFIPTKARTHRVTCNTADGKVGAGVAEVAVTPGPASAGTIDERSKDCFTPNDWVIFEIAVEDRFGNALPTDAVGATVTPSTGFSGDHRSGYRFTVDGLYEITLSYNDTLDANTTIVPHVSTVRIDTQGPSIDIESMSDNGFLVGDPATTPLVGRISDAQSAIAEVLIDGEPLTTDGVSHEIDLTRNHPGRWGLSVVELSATDACGNQTRTTIPTLRSQSFYPPSTGSDPAARIAGALRVQTTQSLVDDGDRSDLDDLATLAELALGTVDFNALIAPGQLLAERSPRNECNGCPFGPTYASSGYRAVRHPSAGRTMNLTGPFLTSLDIVDGGVAFTLEATDFSLPLDLDVHIQQCALGCSTDDRLDRDGSLGAARIEINGRIAVSSSGGSVRGSLQTVTATTEGVWMNVDCGAFDWACDSFEDNLANEVRTALESGIAASVQETLSPLLETSTESLAVSRVVDLPAPFEVSLGIDVGLEDVQFAAGSLPRIGASISSQLFPLARGADISPRQHGAIRLPNAGTAPLPAAQSALAMKVDVLNQLLWAVWYGGGLRVENLSNLGDMFASDIWDGRATFGMPPVVMPVTAANAIDLGLGGLSIHADVDVGRFLGGESYTISMQIDLSAIVRIEVTVDDESNSLRIAAVGEPEMWAEVAYVSDEEYRSFLSDYLEDALNEAIIPYLDEAVAEMPLPTVDLSSINGVPAGTVWSLHEASVGIQGGEMVLSGSLGPSR